MTPAHGRARGAHGPALREFAERLGLPPGFCDREPLDSEAVGALVRSYGQQVPGREFLLGLLFAFVGFVEDLCQQSGEPSLESLLDRFPPEERTPQGGRRNNLFVAGPERGVSVRTYYNRVERVIWLLRRYDYPSCAPHATQAWTQHRRELEELAALSPGERLSFAEHLWAAVLGLPEFTGRAGEKQTPRPFTLLLEGFPESVERVPTGSILQGLAFAYYRADAPNVTLETSKVRTGGARIGRVGDIDGWSGGALVLTIEVKDFEVDGVADVAGFVANLAAWPDATAIVLARSLAASARRELESQKLLTLDRATLARSVALWDVRKQQMAMREFEYFAQRVERNSHLLEALRAFREQRELEY